MIYTIGIFIAFFLALLLFTKKGRTLATRPEAHPNYLSQIINEIGLVNYYDYINNLRIE